MRTRTTTVITATLLLTLSACGSGDDGKPTVTKTSTAPEPITSSAVTTPAAAPTPSTYSLGESAEVDDTENGVRFTATVLAYTQPAKGPQPPDRDTQGGDVWATVEAKVCNIEGNTFSVSQFPWSLAYADGTVVKVTGSTGGDLPKPEFPMDLPVKAGRCVKGKIPFPVMSNTRPERVMYAPEALSDDPVEWTLPKA
ncbi:DUF4352 domain-containing protein [Streptomyces sp. NPDC012769]|uniref:DUF4352 domain-containing protein n=1 Tax=Streptomyces sp. NPDC012769 TaxID=3364848 RepID=UPI0036D12F5F